jgi:hypothetical protein
MGRVRLPVEHLPELRRRPGPVPSPSLPATFLKNSDEQTVVALAAVYQAIHDSDLEATSFGPWGVLAAPHQVGRSAVAQALPSFRAEGAWGMSPHLIPHHSLHCISGAVSGALKMHGPNFGIGEGPAAALPIALAMLARQKVMGLWLVMTALDPPLAPDTSGQPVAGSFGVGLALALTPPRSEREGLRLRVQYDDPLGPPTARRLPLDLFRLLALLDVPGAAPRSAPLQDLGSSGRLALWIEGQVPTVSRDLVHAAAPSPRPAVAGYRAPVPAHALEAPR